MNAIFRLDSSLILKEKKELDEMLKFNYFNYIYIYIILRVFRYRIFIIILPFKKMKSFC